MCSSSLGVTLILLGFSGSHNSSSSLSVKTSRIWIIWLLSLFLHVTIDGDQSPNQKVLSDFILVRASSFSRYDLGL
jgi:hypothetical protein